MITMILQDLISWGCLVLFGLFLLEMVWYLQYKYDSILRSRRLRKEIDRLNRLEKNKK